MEMQRAKKVSYINGSSLSLWKYFFRWRTDMKGKHNSISDEMLWLTYPAIDFIKSNIRKEMSVFEFGGGGSTLFFINRVSDLHTVEHSPEWFTQLKNIIENKGFTNWSGNLYLPEKKVGSRDENFYSSTDGNYSGMHFKSYATSIDKFEDGTFDLVLVDGRARPACLKHSIPKVKSNGFLVLDNSERTYYTEHCQEDLVRYFTIVVDGMAPVPFGESFSKTTIWRKK